MNFFRSVLSMQIVFRASNILEAHIVSGLLQANGIDTHVGGHYLQGAVGDLPATDFAHILVADDDVVSAQQLITDYENGNIETTPD